MTFTNEDNEYQYYEIKYDITEPEVIESIKLTSPVRSELCHVIKLENPLEYESVTYAAECHHPFVTIRHLPRIVLPLSRVS